MWRYTPLSALDMSPALDLMLWFSCDVRPISPTHQICLEDLKKGVGSSRFHFWLQIWRLEYLKYLSAHACEEQVPDGINIASLARGRASIIESFVSFIFLGRVGKLRNKMRREITGGLPVDGGHSRVELR